MAEKESAASLQEKRKIVHIRAGKIIQANLEHMQYDMCRDNAELGKVREERNVLAQEEDDKINLPTSMTEDKSRTLSLTSTSSFTTFFFLWR